LAAALPPPPTSFPALATLAMLPPAMIDPDFAPAAPTNPSAAVAPTLMAPMFPEHSINPFPSNSPPTSEPPMVILPTLTPTLRRRL
jgi:hypothetical protein